MFAKFLKWLLTFVEKPTVVEAPKPPPAADDLYAPKERMIYRYFDGDKQRSVDPIVLYKAIMGDWININGGLTVMRAGMKDAFKGHDDFVGHVRSAFGLKTLDEGGLTEGEIGDLLEHFLEYALEVKKNSRIFPTPPMAIFRGFEQSTTESPPTSNTSDSGETAKESVSDAPAMSNTESALPSDLSPQASLTIERLPMETGKLN